MSANRVFEISKLLDPNTNPSLQERIRLEKGLPAEVLDAVTKQYVKLASECVLNATERQNFLDAIKSYENALARITQDNPQYTTTQVRIGDLHLKLAENYKSDQASSKTTIAHYAKAIEYFANVSDALPSPEISKSRGMACFLYASYLQTVITEKTDDQNKFAAYTGIIAIYREAADHLLCATPVDHNNDVKRALAIVNYNLGKCYIALYSLSNNVGCRADGEKLLRDARKLFNEIPQRTDKDAAAMIEIQRLLLGRFVFFAAPAVQHPSVKHSPPRQPPRHSTKTQETLQKTALEYLQRFIPEISNTINDLRIADSGVLQDGLKCYLFLMCLGINQYLWPYKFNKEFYPLQDTILQLGDKIFANPATNLAGIRGALTAFLTTYTCANLEEEFQAIIKNREHRHTFQASLQSIVQNIIVPYPKPVPSWQNELEQIGLCLHEIVNYATLDNIPPMLVAHALTTKIKVVVSLYEKLPISIRDNLDMLLRNYALSSLLFDAYRSFADHFYLATCLKHLSDLRPEEGRLLKEIRTQATNLRNAATELRDHPETYGSKLHIKRR